VLRHLSEEARRGKQMTKKQQTTSKRHKQRAPTKRSMVMCVFEDNDQAHKAMAHLQDAGIRPDQIRYAERRGGTVNASSLEHLDLPEQEADFYARAFEAGHTVVMVHATDRKPEAYNILSSYSGYDFSTRGSQMGGYASATTQPGTENEQHLKLREEQLQVQKQPVETGEVRVRKDVVSEQQSVDVPVTHEEVYVERRPGSGQPSDTPIGESEAYRVPVHAEQVTVEKQPVVREEVALGKRSVQETQRVSDTVRREEAHVEREGDVNIQGTDAEEVSS
jgi:uncharacterized protein (TIGR02271 family)